MKIPVVTRGMIQTALGAIFYLASDGRRCLPTTSDRAVGTTATKPPVLCFHMSPRSSDEYLEVLPLLAAPEEDDDDGGGDGRLVIAFDLPGYGASENPSESLTIDEMADDLLGAADSIVAGLDDDRGPPSSSSSSSYVTIGSLLGNFCCASLAARHPERIRAGILTNPWFDPTAATADDDETGPPATEPGGAPIPDPFELREDGSHLSDLHRKRSAFLDPDLNLRVVGTELSYLANRRVRYAKGVSIEGGSTYDFGAPCRAIAAATTTARETTTKNHDDDDGGGDGTSFLSIAGESCAGFFDRIGLDGTARFEAAEAMLREAVGVDDDDVVDDDGSSPARFERARLSGDGSTLNLINQMPDEFAAVCRSFLSARGL